MKPIDLCDAGLLKPFAECLDRRGLSSAQYLEHQDISPALVASGTGKIVRPQAWGFFREVAHTEGLHDIGFLANDPFSISDLGPIGRALQRAETLKDAIDTFVRTLPSIALQNTAWLSQGAEQSWLCCRGEGINADEFATDHFTVMALIEVIRLAAGSRWRPTAIRLHTGPHRALELSALVSGIEPIYFQGHSAVQFPTALLSRSLIATHGHPAGDFDVATGTMGPQSTATALELLVETRLRSGRAISINAVAELLNVSRTTIYRALADEGVTWKQLVERMRFRVAKSMLRDTSHSIKAIAYDLGYSEPQNFTRAFRCIAGTSPTAYRDQEAERDD